MAAAFAALPGMVLWRLSPEEVPDLAALVRLGIGRNTKVTAPEHVCQIDQYCKNAFARCYMWAMHHCEMSHGVRVHKMNYSKRHPSRRCS